MKRLKFDLEGLEIVFPFEHIYPEQYKYMLSLKRAIGNQTSSKGVCVLEMPSGTGKTVSLLSLITALQSSIPGIGKLVYCARTIPEVEQTIEEAKKVFQARDSEYIPPQQQQQVSSAFDSILRRRSLALAVASRKNLCVNNSVKSLKEGLSVDSACRDLTCSWSREAQLPGCTFYEGFESKIDSMQLMTGVFSLADLRKFGTENGICPYFLARRLSNLADVVVFSYQYVVDPKIAGFVTKDFRQDCIAVFDEAHNIDDACCESLSIVVSAANLESASTAITRIEEAIKSEKVAGKKRLQEEYLRLLEGLKPSANDKDSKTEDVHASPVLPDDVVNEAMPGSIRKAEHFVGLLKRLTEALKARLQLIHGVEVESPFALTRRLSRSASIDPDSLKFVSERLSLLIRTLELRDIASLMSLFSVAELATLSATYSRGFSVISEPSRGPTVPGASTATIQLCCLDASISFKPAISRFRNVILTSGTMSPLDMYPRILGFRPIFSERFSMTLSRPCALPMLVTRGADQVALSTRLIARDDPAVLRDYGNLLSEMSSVVPDGLVCFFPSYAYLEQSVSGWYEMGLLTTVVSNKLLFVETPDPVESSLALHNYKVACDCGRGAVLLAVARGKLSEGIDFTNQYGRCVIVLGVPFQYTQSRALISRLEFLHDSSGISESEFLTFDAMRAASQCLGRAIRGKSDFALLILADKRFSRPDKRSKLPQWISQALTPALMNISTDTAVTLSRSFFRKMGQPFTIEEQLGKSLWSMNDILHFQQSQSQQK